MNPRLAVQPTLGSPEPEHAAACLLSRPRRRRRRRYRVRGPRAQPAHPPQRRRLREAHAGRPDRHGRSGRLGGRRRVLRVLGARRHRLRRGPLLGARSATGRRSRSRRSAPPTPGEFAEARPRRELARSRSNCSRRTYATSSRPSATRISPRSSTASSAPDTAELGALPRRAGGEVLPPGLHARAARARALGRPGRERGSRRVPGHRPRPRGHRRAPSRHRQDPGLQLGPARDRPHGRGAPPRRDPDRLLPRPPRDRVDRGLRSRARARPSSTSSSPTTAPTRWARRSCPPRARRRSST